MPQKDYNELIEKFQQFRQKLYQSFKHRRDSLMDLLDALANNLTARSIAELSLNPLFRRNYSALYKAVEQFFSPSSSEKTVEEQQLQQLSLLEVITTVIPEPSQRDFYLFGLDVTPVPRPYAKTLEDRSYIYQPNTIKGNKPINVGHPYSILSLLPEKIDTDGVPWSIPLSGQRVPSNRKGIEVGNDQVHCVLNHPHLPWSEKLSVVVADSDYSTKPFIGQHSQQKNLVIITRVRSNRVFYQSPPHQDVTYSRRGHPQWYGERFDLKDETTWHPADTTVQTLLITRQGRSLNLTITAWNQMLMRGTTDYPMHHHPFTLLQIQVSDDKGKLVWKPMWLLVLGQRRDELTPLESYQAYRQRFDLEHLLRFGKQRLLMRAFQTPEAQHEENWIQLTLLAYVQLWAAKKLALHLPRPWERYLEPTVDQKITPSMVQRNYQRIITQIGTPALFPKHRGFSPGRANGEFQTPRPRHKIVKKDKKRRCKKLTAA